MNIEIDWLQTLKSISGENIKNQEQVEVKLRDVCIQALLADPPAGEKLDGGQRVRRYQLAKRVFANSKDISRIDLYLIKSLLGNSGWSTNVVGPAYELLEEAIPGYGADADSVLKN